MKVRAEKFNSNFRELTVEASTIVAWGLSSTKASEGAGKWWCSVPQGSSSTGGGD